ESLQDARHVLLRHRTADHLVLELEARTRRQRLEAELDAGELAGAAGLLLVRVVVLDRTGDGLAIRHLRRADIRLDLELALQAIDDDLEVELAHPLDDRLARLVVD